MMPFTKKYVSRLTNPFKINLQTLNVQKNSLNQLFSKQGIAESKINTPIRMKIRAFLSQESFIFAAGDLSGHDPLQLRGHLHSQEGLPDPADPQPDLSSTPGGRTAVQVALRSAEDRLFTGSRRKLSSCTVLRPLAGRLPASSLRPLHEHPRLLRRTILV